MNLFYTDANTQIYHGDACQLSLVSDKSVAAIITDPPYGADYQSAYRIEKFEPIISDSKFPHVLLQRFLYEAHRVLKPSGAIYIFTDWTRYPMLLPLLVEVFPRVGHPLVWCKDNWSAGALDSDYANRTELVLWSRLSGHKLRGNRPNNVLMFKRVNGGKLLHPTEKPVSLLSYLITKSTDEQDIVLDPFMGSGTTLVAALQVGRRAIGIDIELQWCKVARQRLWNQFLPLFEQVEVSDSNFQLQME